MPHGVKATHEFAVAQTVKRGLTHAGHDAHGHDHIFGVRQLHTNLGVVAIKRPHAKRHHIHGATPHAAPEMFGHFRFHFIRVDPVVGGSGAFFGG